MFLAGTSHKGQPSGHIHFLDIFIQAFANVLECFWIPRFPEGQIRCWPWTERPECVTFDPSNQSFDRDISEGMKGSGKVLGGSLKEDV